MSVFWSKLAATLYEVYEGGDMRKNTQLNFTL